MRKSLSFAVPMVLFMLIFMNEMHGQRKPSSQDTDAMVKAANEVARRLVGARANDVVFQQIVPGRGADVYEVDAKKGKVTVRGTNPIAMTRGLYHYLRDATNSQVTWSGQHLNLPKRLPDYPLTRVATPFKFRLYYNVCTFGYTTAFWDWDQWEKELDWMAIHGINMPLAMAGQEAIWQRVWNSFGVTNEELKEYFSGPAFLPWHRMGNLNKHDGPLPQHWIDQNEELQKKILHRMRELGMHPVVPAFAGFVPATFGQHNPSAQVQRMAPWVGFTDDHQTYMLSPKSRMFIDIGKKYIEEYRKTYGPSEYYLADSFNEMEVPVTTEGRYDELAEFGEAVFKSINAGDSNGTWVMQGWLFYNGSKFWDKPSVQALLRKVPNQRMIIIDLANELWHGWKEHDAFYGKQWIYSVIHNFGGNNPMNGALKFFAADPSRTLRDPARGNLVGFGMSPEGIENNEVVYELLTDAAWSADSIDINQWLIDYCRSRYGRCPPAMRQCWQLLLRSTYTNPGFSARFAFQSRPSLDPRSDVGAGAAVDSAVALFLSCADELGRNEFYRNDLIELAGQSCGNAIDRYLTDAAKLQIASARRDRDTSAQIALDLLADLDRLFASRPDRSLERWIGFARQWGMTDDEKNYYEADAKRQVTVWGGPYLSEYAAKVWSGLIRDYYAPRWQYFFQHLDDGTASNLNQWEEKWITTSGILSPEKRSNDVVEDVRALLVKLDSLDARYSYPISARTEFDVDRRVLDVSLTSAKDDMTIRYTIDRTDRSASAKTYSHPVEITSSSVLKVTGLRKGRPYGKASRFNYPIHAAFAKNVSLQSQYSPKYTAGGAFGLTDCQFGTSDFHDGRWQGFLGDDLDATIDFGVSQPIKKISSNFLQRSGAWIFLPVEVEWFVSDDGSNFKPLPAVKNEGTPTEEGTVIRTFSAGAVNTNARFVRVRAKNIGVCPPGHAGAGQPAWLFVDEIVVE